MKAEEYIASLKKTVNQLSLTYGSTSLIDALVYCEDEVGLMQRAEIKEISDTIARLRRQVHYLNQDCDEIRLTG